MIFRILVQCETLGDLIILIGHCDLYFMVRWFSLISPTLLYGFTSYFSCWFNDTMSKLIILIGQCDLYFMAQLSKTKFPILKVNSHKARSIVF